MLARRHYAIPPAAVAAVAVAVILMLAVAGCGSSAAPAPTATLLPATNTPVPATAPAATAAPVATPTGRPTATAPAVAGATALMGDTPAPPATATEAPTALPPASDAGGSVFTIGEGSVARYKVEEVLARTGFKVATGETSDVAGQVVFDADGNVVAGESRIAVQVGTLRTDSDRRDGYVRNRTLETDDYPEVVFQPNAIVWTEPPAGELLGTQQFTIAGDLTVKDQTRPVVWDATAEFLEDGTASGQAIVEFTFEDFGMDKPSVAIVLSVEDTIRLELDFLGRIAPQ